MNQFTICRYTPNGHWQERYCATLTEAIKAICEGRKCKTHKNCRYTLRDNTTGILIPV
jgi:hypothetical protein